MAETTLRIGLAQFDIAWENRNSNLAHVESLLQFDEPIDLLILPEMWSTGFTMRPEDMAEKHPGPALEWMKDHSQKLNLTIAGSIAVEDGGAYYNRWYCVFPEGKIEHYDKRHLFSFGKEDLHYSPGQEHLIIEIKGWKIMPIVCYDLRFPVWCRNNTGYDLMVVSANWPTPRIHHWDALLKARAIENQCYIAAVNRIGSDDNGHHYPGHSTVFDMNGSALLEMRDKEGIGIATLDKELLEKYREHFRFLQDQDAFQL